MNGKEGFGLFISFHHTSAYFSVDINDKIVDRGINCCNTGKCITRNTRISFTVLDALNDGRMKCIEICTEISDFVRKSEKEKATKISGAKTIWAKLNVTSNKEQHGKHESSLKILRADGNEVLRMHIVRSRFSGIREISMVPCVSN